MTGPSLSRKLVLEEVVRSADGAGGHSESWVPLGIVWAEFVPRTGREMTGEGGPMSRVPMRITVRASPPGSDGRPAAGQRFREGTRLFLIVAVREADIRGRYLICDAVEEVTS